MATAALAACPEPPPSAPDAGFVTRPPRTRPDAGELVRDAMPLRDELTVEVLLDGAPVEGAVVLQGGTHVHHRTDERGRTRLVRDPNVVGDQAVVVSHPEARITHRNWSEAGADPVVIELSRYDRSDNPDYRFQDPGEPERRRTTAQCGHCHNTLNDDWFASPHRTSASNPHVHDSYAGTSHALTNEADCQQRGGRWALARLPGGGDGMRCFVGDGHLTAQPGCLDADCLVQPSGKGQCADCHAPAINGVTGDRDLLEAHGIAYDYGVSCDVCHRVESVHEQGAPGVAGKLQLLRPSEPGDPVLGAGGLLPLTFGPSHDSPNVRMGSVQRDHYRDGSLCSGCHQYDQEATAGLPAPNAQRWPEGRLPVHSTYAEWKAGVFGDQVPCNACHMPPDADVLNGADHQNFPDSPTGLVAGWIRPPGSVRRHVWFGPRQPESGLLEHAATLYLNKAREGDRWVVRVTTINSGAGHAVPTGEPQRQALLRVTLSCDDQPQPHVGGDVLPAYAGALQTQAAGADWRRWSAAQAGDTVRVVRQLPEFRAYEGFGAFAGATWQPSQKGLRVEQAVGSVRVTAVDGEGRIETSAPIPSGDVAYLVRGDDTLAGAPGVAFARVLADAQGRLGVHHSQAVDIVSDNRLMPQARWVSEHRFDASCEAPVAQAQLIHRDFFYDYAQRKAWSVTDRLITQVRR